MAEDKPLTRTKHQSYTEYTRVERAQTKSEQTGHTYKSSAVQRHTSIDACMPRQLDI